MGVDPSAGDAKEQYSAEVEKVNIRMTRRILQDK